MSTVTKNCIYPSAMGLIEGGAEGTDLAGRIFFSILFYIPRSPCVFPQFSNYRFRSRECITFTDLCFLLLSSYPFARDLALLPSSTVREASDFTAMHHLSFATPARHRWLRKWATKGTAAPASLRITVTFATFHRLSSKPRLYSFQSGEGANEQQQAHAGGEITHAAFQKAVRRLERLHSMAGHRLSRPSHSSS